MIEFESGTLYYENADGSLNKFGDVQEIEADYDLDDLYLGYNFIKTMNSAAAEIHCTARLSKDAMMAILGLKNTIINLCPNKRVVHLATHSKKERIRKKNFNRAIKILEKTS